MWPYIGQVNKGVMRDLMQKQLTEYNTALRQSQFDPEGELVDAGSQLQHRRQSMLIMRHIIYNLKVRSPTAAALVQIEVDINRALPRFVKLFGHEDVSTNSQLKLLGHYWEIMGNTSKMAMFGKLDSYQSLGNLYLDNLNTLFHALITNQHLSCHTFYNRALTEQPFLDDRIVQLRECFLVIYIYQD
jgi:hypothetical protein